MKHPLTESLSNKIANFLQSKEGCTLISQKPTSDGVVLELRDVFGFQYTIEMKATTRIGNDIHQEPSVSTFYQKYSNQA